MAALSRAPLVTLSRPPHPLAVVLLLLLLLSVPIFPSYALEQNDLSHHPHPGGGSGSSSCGPAACYQGCVGFRPKVDLVFILDVSLSMSPKIQSLLAGLEEFALELDNTTDALFASVHIGRASFPFQHHYHWWTPANPFLLIDHPPELKQQLTTVHKFKRSLSSLFTFGTKESGLEGLSTSLRIAKKGNLNIHYRTGPNTKKVFVLVTNEDSDAAIHPENRFSTRVLFHTYTQSDRFHDGLCKGSTIDSNTWKYAWQKEIDHVANELASIDASLYLFVPGKKTLDSRDVLKSQACNTPYQYCNPDVQVQSPDYSSFNPQATLNALISKGQQYSLQGQLLAKGKVPRCFDVADTFNEEILNQFYAHIIEETSACDPCMEYSCSADHKCLTPVNICGCDGQPHSGRTRDANGVCCHPSERDCAGLCFGASTFDHPCGVCALSGAARHPACLVDCAGRDYLSLPPNPTSLPQYALLSYQTTCPEVADLLLVNPDILNNVYLVHGTKESVCSHFHRFGRFEARSTCTFDVDLYASTYPEVTPAAARDDWLASLLTASTRTAQCMPLTLTRFPPFVTDQCGQCVTLTEVPPHCVQDCSGAFRRADEPPYFIDNCGYCVAPGSNPDARKDACGVCGGNNQTMNPCGVCGGPMGYDGCGQAVCLGLPCQVDCDGVARNPSTKHVDECGNCVLITDVRDPNCKQDCAAVWYNDVEGSLSPNIVDECGNCLPREEIRLPSCVQDCAGEWGGSASLDQCQQCVASGGQPPYPCEQDCRGVYYRVGLDLLEYSIDSCGICASEEEYNQDVDPCGVCRNTEGYNSTEQCTLDCKGEYHLIDDPNRAFVDACGDCFFGNQTDMHFYNADRCYAYCQPEENGFATWEETRAGNVALGICLPGYAGNITRDCLNVDSLGQWAPLTGACEPVYCPAEVFDGVSYPETRSTTVALGACSAGHFGSVTRNCTDGVWQAPVGGCQACPAGTYQPLTGQQVCTSCPPNSNSPAGSTSAEACTCLPGFVLESGTCQALYCPEATFANATFPATLAGSPATGVCVSGFSGHPIAQCLITGVWSSDFVASPCAEVYSPTCANPFFCGGMGQATCNNCYRSGGLVNPAQPTVCYCPATATYYQTTSPPEDGCTPALPLCPGTYLCDAACLTCGGPASNQCTSCLDTSLELVQGSCVAPCLPTQYRDASGVCQDPNCAALANCHGQGICRHNGTHSVCDCNANFLGADCSIPVSCPTLGECSGNGECLLNPVTLDLYCECNFGWTLANCSVPVTWSYSPTSSTELGGTTVVIFSSVGFDAEDVVSCSFGSTVVPGTVQEPTAFCFAPPHFKARRPVTLSITVNGNVKTLGDFAYVFSDGLPYTPTLLNQFVWVIGTPKTISYASTPLNGAGENVTASLYRWYYDPYEYLDPYDPVLEDLGVIAVAPNIGNITLTLNVPPYDRVRSLYIISLTSGAVTNRRYALPREPNFNSSTECQYFVDWSPEPLVVFNPCYSWNSAAIAYHPCEVLDNYPSIGSLTSIHCRVHNWKEDMCLYENHPTQGYILALQVWEPNHFNDIEAEVVRYFYTTQVNKINCCTNPAVPCSKYLSRRKLDGFLSKRKRSPGELAPRADPIPEASSPGYFTGFVYGSLHLFTPDNAFLTFNGLGEFTLLQDPGSSFEIQIRNSPVTLAAGAATYLSAVVVTDAVGGTMEVHLDAFGVFRVLLNDYYDPVVLQVDGEPFHFQPGGMAITLLSESSLRIAVPNEVVLLAEASQQTISLRVILPEALKGQLRGLLGVYDGDSDNDFTFRDGSVVLPPTATTEELLAFGLSWMVTEETSHFSYPVGQGYADFNDPAFVPSFPEAMPYDPELTLTSQERCAAAGPKPFSSACVFDVLVRRSLASAVPAISGGRSIQAYLTGLNQAPLFVGLPPLQPAGLGETVTVTFTLSLTLGTTASVFVSSTPIPEGVFDAGALSYTFTWTEEHFLSSNLPLLTFSAVDNHDASADASVKITNNYASCDSFDQVVVEANLELSTFCPVDADTCSDDCSRVMARLVALDCYRQLAKEIGEPLTNTREVCCDNGNNPSVSCGGLQPFGIVLVVLSCLVVGVILSIVVAFAIKKLKRNQPSDDEASSPLVAEKAPRTSYGN